MLTLLGCFTVHFTCTFLSSVGPEILGEMDLFVPVYLLWLGEANTIHWWLTASVRIKVTRDKRVRIHAASLNLAASASAFQQAPDHIVFRFDRNILSKQLHYQKLNYLQVTGEAARALCR